MFNLQFRYLFVETRHALSLQSIATKGTIVNGEFNFRPFLSNASKKNSPSLIYNLQFRFLFVVILGKDNHKKAGTVCRVL